MEHNSIIRKVALAAAMLAMTGCTQPPAEISTYYSGKNLTVQKTSYPIVTKPEGSGTVLPSKYSVLPVAEKQLHDGFHVVQKGETLFSIARAYDMEPEMIQDYNTLSDSDLLFVGQRLNLEPVPVTEVVKQTFAATPTKHQQVKPKMLVKFDPNKPQHFMWPVKGRVISRFGVKEGGMYNDGINIAASEGSAVQAVEDGEVVYAGSKLKAYGNMVIIRHGDGWLSAYAHTADIVVKRGDVVAKGQRIATVGRSGDVTEPQLHFGLRKKNKSINPLQVLAG